MLAEFGSAIGRKDHFGALVRRRCGIGGGRDAVRRGLKLPVNNMADNVRGRGGHFRRSIRIFLGEFRRGCDRNSAVVFAVGALIKCRLQRRRHYSLELE